MKDDDACNFCGALLDAHCDEGERQGDPRFCQLKDEYWTTPMSSDQMLDRLYSITTPEQLAAVDSEVTRRMKAHQYSPAEPSAPVAVPVRIDLGECRLPTSEQQAAAQRWIQGYQGNGRQP